MARKETFYDRRRRVVLAALGGASGLLGGLLAADGYAGDGAWFAVVAAGFLWAAWWQVTADGTGVRIRGWGPPRRIPWDDIAQFELRRVGLRLHPVPTVLRHSGGVHPLYGLDSVLSGFGAASPMWDIALARLEQLRLGRQRVGGWHRADGPRPGWPAPSGRRDGGGFLHGS